MKKYTKPQMLAISISAQSHLMEASPESGPSAGDIGGSTPGIGGSTPGIGTKPARRRGGGYDWGDEEEDY